MLKCPLGYGPIAQSNDERLVEIEIEGLSLGKLRLCNRRIHSICRTHLIRRIHSIGPNEKEAFVILTTLEGVPSRQVVEHYGLVQGNSVRAKNVGKDFLAGLKNLVGGELKAYTELLQESRKEATERMIAQAQQVGANAVVNIRFATSSISAGAAELYVYGTAVRVQ